MSLLQIETDNGKWKYVIAVFHAIKTFLNKIKVAIIFQIIDLNCNETKTFMTIIQWKIPNKKQIAIRISAITQMNALIIKKKYNLGMWGTKVICLHT